jgi:hypothetical protein
LLIAGETRGEKRVKDLPRSCLPSRARFESSAGFETRREEKKEDEPKVNFRPTEAQPFGLAARGAAIASSPWHFSWRGRYRRPACVGPPRDENFCPPAHVSTARGKVQRGWGLDPLDPEGGGILPDAIFFKEQDGIQDPQKKSRGEDDEVPALLLGPCCRLVVVVVARHRSRRSSSCEQKAKAKRHLRERFRWFGFASRLRGSSSVPVVIVIVMSDQGNIFLTWENLAFSLPLLTVVGAYVSGRRAATSDGEG